MASLGGDFVNSLHNKNSNNLKIQHFYCFFKKKKHFCCPPKTFWPSLKKDHQEKAPSPLVEQGLSNF